MLSLTFLLTSLIVVLIPGTGVLYTVSTALIYGRSAGSFAAIGCTMGIIPHLLATVLGLSAVMHASASVFQLMKIAGAIYLLYLAYVTWKDRRQLELCSEQETRPQVSFVIKGILLNILNPKLTVFFFAFLPQFISHEGGNYTYQLFGLSSVFMVMTLVVFVLYGYLANCFRSTIIERPSVQRWIQKGVSSLFAVLGIKLILSGE
jgi:threonine/homoserine/homoserine lactone efflux protein